MQTMLAYALAVILAVLLVNVQCDEHAHVGTDMDTLIIEAEGQMLALGYDEAMVQEVVEIISAHPNDINKIQEEAEALNIPPEVIEMLQATIFHPGPIHQ